MISGTFAKIEISFFKIVCFICHYVELNELIPKVCGILSIGQWLICDSGPNSSTLEFQTDRSDFSEL